MAIFFNHIKGCGASSTGQSDSTKDLWTWIKFADITGESTNEQLTGTNKDTKYLPSILIYSSNDTTATKFDFGKIITSNAINQIITPSFVFNNNLDIGGNLTLKDLSSQGISYIGKQRDILIAKNSCLFFNANEYTSTTNIRESKIGQIYGTTYDSKYYLIISAQSKTGIYDQYIQYNAGQHQFTNGPIWCQQHLHVGNDDYTFPTDSAENGTIKADYKCEALYFNATSDKRAKENITPTKFSALSIVKTLPTYTFNYKSNPNQKVLGLIAQDAAAHDLDGFNMVDNIEATGEGSDMMQMKESKLVYILWKAVQELSAEVEELKAEIASLK